MSTRLTALAGVGVLVGALTACSPQGTGPIHTPPGTSTPHTSPTTHVLDEGGSDWTPYAKMQHEFDGATDVPASSYHGKVTAVGFTTYDKDLGCGFQDGAVTCQLTAQPGFDPPKDCHGAGVPGIVLADGEDPYFKCMGDVESGGAVIKDSLTISVGDLQCVSKADGVTCIDGKQHGFRFGTESYSLTRAAGTSPAPTPDPTDSGDDGTRTNSTGLAGQYFTGEGTYGDDTSLGYDYGVWFLPDGWAFWGRPKAGQPTCSKVTGHPTSDDLNDGWGCVHYTYDADSGTVTVGSLTGHRDGDSIGFGDESLSLVALPTAGERFATSVSNTGYSNCDDLFGDNCHTWTTYFKTTKDGRFALSSSSLTTWGGVDSGSVLSESPDEHGTYQVLSGGRIELSYKSGKVETRTIATGLGAHGKPELDDIVLGTTDFTS